MMALPARRRKEEGDMADEIHTGGCQCGAVRFRVEGKLGDASVCHCACARRRAAISTCRSFPYAARSSYGPAASASASGPRMWLARLLRRLRNTADLRGAGRHGARDRCIRRPEGIAPTIQWGVEGKLPYVDHVSKLPGEETMTDPEAVSFLADLVSYQHPDHDTETWPPEERG